MTCGDYLNTSVIRFQLLRKTKKNVADVLVTSWLVTSLFSLFRFRVVLCTQVQKFLPLSSAFFSTEVRLIAKNCSRILCWCVFMHIFWANSQRVPGQDALLGNRLGFNSRDHMAECQNQLSVTCSCSWVSLGKARPEGGRKLFTVRLSKVCVCVCMC